MLFNIFLTVHIIAGTIALLTGPLAIAARKGGLVHRRVGITFFYAMLVVAATAFVLGTLHHIPFLIVVGIFTTYTDLTGYRVLYQKQRGRLHQTTRFDHTVSAAMLLGSGYFLVYGLYGVWHRDAFGLVFVFFSLRSLQMLWQDWKLFRQQVTPTTWLQIHLTRMLSTCVAAYTAFAVVNSSSRLSLVGWLLPAILGAPVAIYWSKKVKAKRRPVPSGQPIPLGV